MIKVGDKVIWKNNGSIKEAIVHELLLQDDPRTGTRSGQRLVRSAWRLIRKGWVLVTVTVPQVTGTFWAASDELDPLPIDKQENIKKWEETTESLIRNEMVEE
jgi:hypothetical protein